MRNVSTGMTAQLPYLSVR